jgi:transcriptional regulator with XRE-family HTH domain
MVRAFPPMATTTKQDKRFFASVGRQVRARRKDNGKTLQELADKSGVTKQTISMVELGEVDISIRKLARICEALHCSLADFFEPERGRERAA